MACFSSLTRMAQTELTYQEAKTLYKNVNKSRTSVHDPSVVYDETSQRYYVFGSHRGGAYTTNLRDWTNVTPTWKTATSNNASNADAFVTPAVKKVMKGGTEVDLPAFNACDWSKRTDSNYDINGNMWAPDVIWNPTMKKWCYYLSVNGDSWHSSIILLTSDNITGPYLYQGPVIICGFDNGSHSYKDTDLEMVIGQQDTLPDRYNVGTNGGKRWPHTIDPTVFFDEEGKLWMAYGSWSGGIWMLELDEKTGLRDYDVSYPSTNGNSDGVISDPYFGTKIAGGYYVSGEGAYIEHIGDYYYLFISYGFFSPDGGYEMRVFRSDKPDGPYKDSRNVNAIFKSYQMNYGKGGDRRGEKIMGAYNNWGFMTVGECAQGHNSIIAAPDGRTYLVYHTKFNDGTVGHQVRVHQVFVNKDGWLVAAPFEYNGEETTDADIASRQPFTREEIAGTYQLLDHKYGMDYANYEEMTPVKVTLHDDGTISGSKTGSWSIEEGTGYITLSFGSLKYEGVVTEEVMDTRNIHAVAFTACNSSTGANVWGYRMTDQYELAWQLNNQKEPVTQNKKVQGDLPLDLLSLGLDNVSMTWTSTLPEVISNHGKYNPTGLAEDTPVTLTALLEAGNYYWKKEYQVTALSEANTQPTDGWQDGMVAHYGFDKEPMANSFDNSQTATLAHKGSTKNPALYSDDALRTGQYVRLNFGANGQESYVEMPNPLHGQTLNEGATLSFWVKRSDDNHWDALFGVVSGNARFYMTGNTYLGYNDGQTSGTNNWVDINHPTAVTPSTLSVGQWHLVTLTIARNGIKMYVDGSKKSFSNVNGSLNGKSVTTEKAFDYGLIVDLLTQAKTICLGKGSFWGSADACFDDVVIYNRPIGIRDAISLYNMENRVFDFSTIGTGIEDINYETDRRLTDTLYDLHGRRINGTPAKGIYVLRGKKVIIK